MLVQYDNLYHSHCSLHTLSGTTQQFLVLRIGLYNIIRTRHCTDCIFLSSMIFEQDEAFILWILTASLLGLCTLRTLLCCCMGNDENIVQQYPQEHYKLWSTFHTFACLVTFLGSLMFVFVNKEDPEPEVGNEDWARNLAIVVFTSGSLGICCACVKKPNKNDDGEEAMVDSCAVKSSGTCSIESDMETDSAAAINPVVPDTESQQKIEKDTPSHHSSPKSLSVSTVKNNTTPAGNASSAASEMPEANSAAEGAMEALDKGISLVDQLDWGLSSDPSFP